MRITHVVRQYSPGVGGLEEVVETLATAQAGAGHAVRVVTLDRLIGTRQVRVADRETINGVEIVRIPFVGSHRYPIALSVLGHIATADLVHVHGIDFFFDFLGLTRLFHRKPMVATTHGGFFHTTFAARLKRLWFRTITRASARAYEGLVACSEPDETLFRRIAPRRLRLIENGVRTGKFDGMAARHRPAMIYFGRLAPNKGLDRLLRWFGAVHAGAPEWTLTIAGRPMGVTVAELRAQADALGILDAVEFVVFPSDAELAKLIARASVFACASSYEGFGLAVAEAASAGLFPVVSDLPTFRIIVSRIGEGLVVDFDAPAEAAARFLDRWRALTDADIEAMHGRAHAEFGWPRALDRYDRLYDEILKAPRRIGEVAVAVRGRDEALAEVRQGLMERTPMMVAFCNAHTVNLARSDPAFARALRPALVLNDGVGVDMASRLLFGRPFPDNLNGTDFVPALLSSSARPLRIYLLGSAPGVAEDAAGRLGELYPRHRVVGAHHGHYRAADEGAIAAEIKAAKPDLVLVGMGHPRQELCASNALSRVPAVTMCIGAYLDFVAGRVPRAPAWMRRFRLEWMYRLYQEPTRLWRRYLVGNLTFMFFVVLQRLTGAPATAPATASPVSPQPARVPSPAYRPTAAGASPPRSSAGRARVGGDMIARP